MTKCGIEVAVASQEDSDDEVCVMEQPDIAVVMAEGLLYPSQG